MATPRPIRVDGDVAYIPLTRGKVAVIDAADVPLVEGLFWHAMPGRKTWYAASRIKERGNRIFLLHRIIMGADSPTGYDHEDRNGLNCRRANLRPATPAQNGANRPAQSNNSSGTKGVFFNGQRGNWMAALKVNGVFVLRRQFKSRDAAAAAYEAACREHNQEFAHL